MDKPNYQVVQERKFISREDNPEIYKLENTACSAFSKILNHRVKKYNEDRYRQALPSELLTFLESYDSQASLTACIEYLIDELTRRRHYDLAMKVKELNLL